MITAPFASSLKEGKNFKSQPLENLDKIQEELTNWLIERNSLNVSQTMPLEDLGALEYTNKEIRKFGNPIRLTYWVVKPHDTIPSHIDGVMEHFGIPRSRLLIPVLNYTETETIFYKNINPKDFEDFKDPRVRLQYIRPKETIVLDEEERFILDTPIWMRIDKLHAIQNHGDSVRASFTVFYDRETQLKHTPL